MLPPNRYMTTISEESYATGVVGSGRKRFFHQAGEREKKEISGCCERPDSVAERLCSKAVDWEVGGSILSQ